MLFSRIFVSRSEATRDDESLSYESLSPPTNNLAQYSSVFNGRWSNQKEAHVKFSSVGTSDVCMISMVSVEVTPCLFPWASLSPSLLNA